VENIIIEFNENLVIKILTPYYLSFSRNFTSWAYYDKTIGQKRNLLRFHCTGCKTVIAACKISA